MGLPSTPDSAGGTTPGLALGLLHAPHACLQPSPIGTCTSPHTILSWVLLKPLRPPSPAQGWLQGCPATICFEVLEVLPGRTSPGQC